MKKLIATAAVALSLAVTGISAKVVASVNGYTVTDKEANRLLKVLTRGKLKYSQLKPADKKEIVKRVAIDKIVVANAKRGLSAKEKKFVLANAYLAKAIRGVKVSDSEAKRIYNANKKFFTKKGKLTPYSRVRNMIKVQLKQKKVIDRLARKYHKRFRSNQEVFNFIANYAKNHLTRAEKNFVIANAWMAKKTRGIGVTTAEARKAYNQNKQLFKRKGKLVPFSRVKNIIKMQLRQKKVIDRLMRNAKIRLKG
jgi:D-ribose pyranose/furanose isomerase RbsD